MRYSKSTFFENESLFELKKRFLFLRRVDTQSLLDHELFFVSEFCGSHQLPKVQCVLATISETGPAITQPQHGTTPTTADIGRARIGQYDGPVTLLLRSYLEVDLVTPSTARCRLDDGDLSSGLVFG